MTDYFTDNAPVLLTGVTGAQGNYGGSGNYGGKSSTATWWADEPGRERDLVIWANFKSDDVAGVLDDFREVGSVEELAHAMGEGARRLVLTPRDHDWPAVSRRLEAFVAELPQEMTKLVVLDECPELDEDAVLSFVRVHGNGANCKTLVLAQSPTDLPTAIVKQCLLVWVGPMKTDYVSWFRSKDLKPAYDYILDQQGPYEFTVIYGKDEGDWAHHQPVPEVYAEI